MDKKNLISMIAFLSIGFVCGFLAAMLLGARSMHNYGSRQDFAEKGFGQVLSNEAKAKIKKVSDKSLTIEVNARTDRHDAQKEQELKLTERSEVLLKTAKTNDELYGQEAAARLEELVKLKTEAGRSRELMMEIESEMRAIKEAALAVQNQRLTEMAKEIEALASDDSLGREQLTAKMKALAYNYKLTPIKLSDLQVGEMVSVLSAQPIDWSSPMEIERLIVERN